MFMRWEVGVNAWLRARGMAVKIQPATVFLFQPTEWCNSQPPKMCSSFRLGKGTAVLHRNKSKG